MEQHVLVGLASIIVLGVAAQWIASRMRLPSILLLLGFGLLAGPVTGFLKPDELLKDLLLPLVSLSVAVILYEGGLSLKVRDLRGVGGVLGMLTTVGVLVTWGVTTLAGHWLLGLSWDLAALLGAVLSVTGPTVINPLLRHLRLGGAVGSVLKWEGIVIDPVGAMLAVLVFGAVRADQLETATTGVVVNLLRTLLVGGSLGVLGAALLAFPLRRFWIPDSLHNPVSLAVLFAVFTASNLLQHESGLLTVTVMGIVLANQPFVAIKHLVEFKENLTVLLISGLFIILAGRLKLEDVEALPVVNSLLFLGVLIVVARPLAVMVSTLGSRLNWRERAFLAWMAPRGIVAAAVSSVFALELIKAGHEEANQLVPLTFLVIVGTVLVYGLTAGPVAWRLGLAKPNPQGVLFVGAHGLARAIARALQKEKVGVLLVDTNWWNVSASRLAGLPTFYGSILAEDTIDALEFSELGQLVAMTSNEEMNSLACMRFTEFFGREKVYQLPFEASEQEGRREIVPTYQRGRTLFGPGMTYAALGEHFSDQPEVKTTRLSKEFDFKAFREQHGAKVLPVAVIRQDGKVALFTIKDAPKPEAGDLVISMVAKEPLPALEENENAPAGKDIEGMKND